jgi:hypothetical protein
LTIKSSQQRAAIEQIWSAGGTVISVTPKTQSLEQLFVDLMKAPLPPHERAQ